MTFLRCLDCGYLSDSIECPMCGSKCSSEQDDEALPEDDEFTGSGHGNDEWWDEEEDLLKEINE